MLTSNHFHAGIVLKSKTTHTSSVVLFTAEFGKIIASPHRYKKMPYLHPGMIIICSLQAPRLNTLVIDACDIVVTPNTASTNFYWICHLIELLDLSLPLNFPQATCFQTAQNILNLFINKKSLSTKIRLLCILLLFEQLALNENNIMQTIDPMWQTLIIETMNAPILSPNDSTLHQLESINENDCYTIIKKCFENHPRFAHFKTFDALFSQRIIS